MFDFNIVVQASKKTLFEYVDGNFLVNSNSDYDHARFLPLNAKEANAVIEAMFTKVESQFNNHSHLKQVDFDTFVSEVKLVEQVRHVLIDFKKINCAYGKTLEDHCSRVITRVNSFYNKLSDICKERFNPMENHVLNKVTYYKDHYFTYTLGSENDSFYYDVRTDSTKESEQNLKEALAFDYCKYDVDESSIHTFLNNNHQEEMEVVEAFRYLKKEVGEDLINWGKAKITRKLREKKEYADKNSDYVWAYTDGYREVLESKGITKTVKNKKLSRADKLYKEADDGKSDFSQDDLVCLLKSGKTQDHWALPKMTKATLLEVITINTKSFDKRLTGGRFSTKGLNASIIAEFNKHTLNKKEMVEYLKFVCTHRTCLSSISYVFFHNHADIFPKELFKDWATNFYPWLDRLNTVAFDYLEKHFELTDLLNFTTVITEGYMTERMSSNDVLKILKNGYEVIKVPRKDKTVKLVEDCSRESITEAFKSSAGTMHCIERVATERSYNDLCNYFIANTELGLSDEAFSEHVITLADESVFRDRIRLDISGVSDKRNSLMSVNTVNGSHLGINTVSIILEETFKSHKAYPIFNASCNRMGELKPALLNKFLKGLDSLYKFGYYGEDVLTKATRKHIASLDPEFVMPNEYIYERMGYSDDLLKFFKDFNRQEAVSIYGEEFMFCNFRYYLAQAMDAKELKEIADRDGKFLRLHIELFQYGYLRKYKDKEKFKKLVGDRRDTGNRSFGKLLLTKLDTSNTLDFMFS